MVSRSSYYRAPAAERFVIAATELEAFVGVAIALIISEVAVDRWGRRTTPHTPWIRPAGLVRVRLAGVCRLGDAIRRDQCVPARAAAAPAPSHEAVVAASLATPIPIPTACPK